MKKSWEFRRIIFSMLWWHSKLSSEYHLTSKCNSNGSKVCPALSFDLNLEFLLNIFEVLIPIMQKYTYLGNSVEFMNTYREIDVSSSRKKASNGANEQSSIGLNHEVSHSSNCHTPSQRSILDMDHAELVTRAHEGRGGEGKDAGSSQWQYCIQYGTMLVQSTYTED